MGKTLVQIKEQRHEETTLNYTPQQITDHCEKIDTIGCNGDNDREMLFESLAIIRQLQERLGDIEDDYGHYEAYRDE